MSRLILVTGGARAGKSAFAQAQAQRLDTGVSFIATAQALDQEMQERIERHRLERPFHWQTIEEPLEVSIALAQALHPVVVLDCLTLWVSNLMHSGRDVGAEVGRLLSLQAGADKTLIAVSNEVGMGIVPDNALARRYRDWLGTANRAMAEQADEVYLLVSGIPLQIKSGPKGHPVVGSAGVGS
jgi:adenosyl cobinamide kinase/adenosyl cobinamide phosphate guanylyltransferase